MLTTLSASQGRRAIEGLSPPELLAMQYTAYGLEVADIASKVHRSPNTIKGHIQNAVAKLNACTKSHAIVIAMRDQLITMERRNAMAKQHNGKPPRRDDRRDAIKRKRSS